MMLRNTLFITFVVMVYSHTFNPSIVHFVDKSPSGNWLFRGNEPKNSSNLFAIDELYTTLRAVAKAETNNSLPEDFYILDFNLDGAEFEDTKLESEFFEKNPNIGNVTHWLTLGDVFPPELYTEAERKQKAMTLGSWQYDNLPKRIALIRDYLYSSPGPRPLVIYVHCEVGSDRTGEIIGSYYMAYLSFPSFKAALELDNKIAGRPMLPWSVFAFQWYCYYLQYAQNYTIDCSV